MVFIQNEPLRLYQLKAKTTVWITNGGVKLEIEGTIPKTGKWLKFSYVPKLFVNAMIYSMSKYMQNKF